jgi:G3E family GTPase
MEANGELVKLDAILTVVDCINFTGYEDTSYTAKMQAQYTDLILLNKWEQVSDILVYLVWLNETEFYS